MNSFENKLARTSAFAAEWEGQHAGLEKVLARGVAIGGDVRLSRHGGCIRTGGRWHLLVLGLRILQRVDFRS